MKYSEYELTGFITNLGKYNEGYLIGKYIKFPINSEELSKALKEIGINEYYEEWFFTDYDGTYPRAVYDMLGEYTSIAEINKIALALQKVCGAGVQEPFEAFLENGNDFYSSCANAIEGNYIYYKGSDYSDLANYHIEAIGGVEQLPNDSIEYYFDFERFGRDIRLEYYQVDDDSTETAAGFWCGDENASDFEIGQAFIDECGLAGVAHKEYYFNLLAFGKDIYDEGEFVFTDNGIVDCSDFDNSLGEDFKRELNEELEEKGDDER